MTFQICNNTKGEWWFRIKANNGKIIAFSETYKNKEHCMRMINKIIGVKVWRLRYAKKQS
jgi:uncharacterized protein YegP (UPF0339 family)